MKREKNNSSITIKNKITIIKIFFEFLCQEGIYGLNHNPSLRLSNIKVDRKLPQVLSLEESRKFLINIKKVSSFPERDFAMFLLFLHTGCRLNELKMLTLSIINLKAQHVRFRGKGNKERAPYKKIIHSVNILQELIK